MPTSVQQTKIVSRTISAIEDRRIQLAGTNIARKMNIGNSWTTLRIGMRVCYIPANPGTGTIIYGTPRFIFGVCSGVVNTVGSESPSHFVGIRSMSTAGEYKTTGNDVFGNNGTTTGLAWGAIRYENGSLTSAVGGKVGSFSAEPSTIRSALFLQIVKTGGNITVQLYAPTDTGAKTDISSTAFFNTMEGELMDGLTNYNTNTAETISTLDEATYGDLDSINVYWDRTFQKIEISDLAYTRVN